jgi:hypothetical protein
MDKMELKKGYTPAELNAFMQEVFRSGRKAERTPDGGWRVVEIKAHTSDTKSASCIEKDDLPYTTDGSCIEKDDLPYTEQSTKKGVWKRFKSFFKSK